jgi:hypothetical protein
MSILRIAAAALVLMSAGASAAELSLTSLGYQSESKKVAGTKAGSESIITLGARYGELLGDDVHWFGQARIQIVSYDAPSGTPAPSDSTGLRLGGGLRYHVMGFSEGVTPYLLAGGAFVNEESGEVGSADGEERNGLVYNAAFGFRFNLGADFFAEVETNLFESSLFANREVTVGGVKTEYSSFELYADTHESTTPISVNVGMKF